MCLKWHPNPLHSALLLTGAIWALFKSSALYWYCLFACSGRLTNLSQAELHGRRWLALKERQKECLLACRNECSRMFISMSQLNVLECFLALWATKCFCSTKTYSPSLFYSETASCVKHRKTKLVWPTGLSSIMSTFSKSCHTRVTMFYAEIAPNTQADLSSNIFWNYFKYFIWAWLSLPGTIKQIEELQV